MFSVLMTHSRRGLGDGWIYQLLHREASLRLIFQLKIGGGNPGSMCLKCWLHKMLAKVTL